MRTILKVKRLHEDAVIPTRGSTMSSGLDLYALESYLIKGGETILIRTGIAFEIPENHEIQIRPRSGLSLNTNLRIANAPGTIDRDYLGEIKVIMSNYDMLNKSDVFIKKGDRIAQAILCPIVIPELVEINNFEITTERGESGFGSTGVNNNG